MEQTLKSETTRLAKKQLGATYLPLARDVRWLRQALSALRKTIAVLAGLGAELGGQRAAEWARLGMMEVPLISAGLVLLLRASTGRANLEAAHETGNAQPSPHLLQRLHFDTIARPPKALMAESPRELLDVWLLAQ
jgi:hypothetical protein